MVATGYGAHAAMEAGWWRVRFLAENHLKPENIRNLERSASTFPFRGGPNIQSHSLCVIFLSEFIFVVFGVLFLKVGPMEKG